MKNKLRLVPLRAMMAVLISFLLWPDVNIIRYQGL